MNPKKFSIVALAIALSIISCTPASEKMNSITVLMLPSGDTVYAQKFDESGRIKSERIMNSDYWSSGLTELLVLPQTGFRNINAHFFNTGVDPVNDFNWDLPYFIVYDRSTDPAGVSVRNTMNSIPYPDEYEVSFKDTFTYEQFFDFEAKIFPDRIYPLHNITEKEEWNFDKSLSDSTSILRSNGNAMVHRKYDKNEGKLEVRCKNFIYYLSEVSDLVNISPMSLAGVQLNNDWLYDFAPLYHRFGNKVFRNDRTIFDHVHEVLHPIDTMDFTYHPNGQLARVHRYGTNERGKHQDFSVDMNDRSQLLSLLSKEYSQGELSATSTATNSYEDGKIIAIEQSFVYASRPGQPSASTRSFEYDDLGRITRILTTNHVNGYEGGYQVIYE